MLLNRPLLSSATYSFGFSSPLLPPGEVPPLCGQLAAGCSVFGGPELPTLSVDVPCLRNVSATYLSVPALPRTRHVDLEGGLDLPGRLFCSAAHVIWVSALFMIMLELLPGS